MGTVERTGNWIQGAVPYERIDAVLIRRFQKWRTFSSRNGSLGPSRMQDSGPAPVFRDYRWVVGAAPVYALRRRFQHEVTCNPPKGDV